jgi:hypothetical protein
VGEYLILLGAFEASPVWAVVGVSGVILGAVYLLMATRRVLWGPIVHEANRRLKDLSAREIALMVPMVALVVWIGVAPNSFLHKGQGSLDLVLRRLERARVQLADADGAERSESVAAEMPADGVTRTYLGGHRVMRGFSFRDAEPVIETTPAAAIGGAPRAGGFEFQYTGATEAGR